MKVMKKNVGTFDATMRIMWGLLGLSWGISRMVRYPSRTTPFLVSIISAMKVAEGVTRWCPMLQMFGLTTIEKAIDIKSKIKKASVKQIIYPTE